MRAKRYCELRRTVFAPDNLNQRFSAYWQLMRSSGAMKREAKKWRSAGNAGLSFEAEADYITDSNDEDGVAAALEKLALSGGLH